MLPAELITSHILSPPMSRWHNSRLAATTSDAKPARRTRRARSQRNSLADQSTEKTLPMVQSAMPSFSLNGISCPIRPRTASLGRKPPSPVSHHPPPLLFTPPTRVLIFSPGKRPKVDTTLERFQTKQPRSQGEPLGLELGVYGCTYGVPVPFPRKTRGSPGRRTELSMHETPSPLSL
jgi:hypothetical protein